MSENIESENESINPEVLSLKMALQRKIMKLIFGEKVHSSGLTPDEMESVDWLQENSAKIRERFNALMSEDPDFLSKCKSDVDAVAREFIIELGLERKNK